ncbi:AfsR/SARP family transcriptional regulator [Plantactinospora sp. WMMB782]|uniref:AfsR/SARP family transcriptional regulator n=1 Tax=Plantactinospora sp. WMMB782 TaxID=3404121 RepID=UPI003B942076
MEFVILGQTALSAGGRAVSLGAAKQRGLLAVLLYRPGSAVPVDVIVDHLWGNRPVDACRGSLHALVSRNRSVLRAAGLPNALARTPGADAYRLDVDPELVDYHRFCRLVDRARRSTDEGDHERSTKLLSTAVDLWRDEPLADLRGASSEHMRRTMKEKFLAAHLLLAASHTRIGRYDEVIRRLEPLLLTYDVDQALARHWITALYASGREDEARRFSIDFRHRFRRKLRTEPTIDLPSLHLRPRSARGGTTRNGSEDPAGFRPPQQLPADISDFTGRRDVLVELDAVVRAPAAGSQVVVVTGMPGVGKTTLVVHWAHRHRDRFPDGQLYLDADGYGPTPPVTPEDALGRFLRALGVPADRVPPGGEQRRERFNQLLADRRVLIVLDNVRNSDQVRPLLPTAEGCVTVVTSRTRLISLTVRQGIRSLVVPPLSDEDRRTLLSRVIGTVRTRDEPGPTETLAQFSDGLPLALRIMGEQITARPRASIAEMVDELGARLLDSPDDDEDDAKLSTVFAWSYNELDSPAARLFRLLGLHLGRNISPAAAAALLGTEPRHAERLLDGLAKRHLVNYDTASRYQLHDLLRRYAAHRAQQEEPAQCRRAALCRLLDWYLLSATNAARVLTPHRRPVPDLPEPDAVEPLRFGGPAEAQRWCEAERANLAAMVRSAADNGFHRHAWQIPGAVHEFFGRYGRQDDVLVMHQIALEAAETDTHQIGQIGTLNNLGGTYFALHDYHRAASAFEAGLRLARRLGASGPINVCSHNLANVYLKSGDVHKAVGIFKRVLTGCREGGDLLGQAAILHRLGDAHQQLRRYDQAALCYREALAIRERLAAWRDQAVTHERLAALQLRTGEPEAALRRCELALALQDRGRDDATRCDILITAADAERALGRYPAALERACSAIALSDGIADSRRRAAGLAVLADTFLAGGDRSDAYDHCLEALAIIGELTGSDLDPVLNRLLKIESALAPGPPGQRIASTALRAATSTGSQTGAYGGA